MINKTKDLTFITEVLSELPSYENIKIPATSNRNLSHFRASKTQPSTAYQYPETYKEFHKRQQNMHKEGVEAAQLLVKEYLPPEFKKCLMENNSWDLPYTFPKPKGTVIVSNKPPTYNKLHVSVDADLVKDIQAEVDLKTCLNITPTADCEKMGKEDNLKEKILTLKQMLMKTVT